MILIQFFDPFWQKSMHHNQSKLLFPFIYSRSIYFISAAFSQSVTTFHLLQQNSKMEKYLIEISFFLFRLVEMFEICSRTSVMATTYCHCSKCSRAKYWYVHIILSCQLTFDDFFKKDFRNKVNLWIILTSLTWLIHTSVLPSIWNPDKMFAPTGQLGQVNMVKKIFPIFLHAGSWSFLLMNLWFSSKLVSKMN